MVLVLVETSSIILNDLNIYIDTHTHSLRGKRGGKGHLGCFILIKFLTACFVLV